MTPTVRPVSDGGSGSSHSNSLAAPLLFGAAVAAWAGQTAFLHPGADYAVNIPLLLAPVLLLIAADVTARRHNQLRSRAVAVIGCVGMLAFGLLLFSTGLGLVAGGLAWAVVIVAAVGFAVTAGGAALLIRVTG